ncbi:MAG: endo-1,4-beta-xylanase [Pirellulaceae bacterium]
MGQMRFVAARQEAIPPDAVERAYLAGMEGIPWRSRNWWTDVDEESGPGEFILQRDASDSGNLYIPWCVEGFHELVLSTGSLMERDRPYRLPLELARGTVNRIRNQVAEWQCMGLQLSAELSAELQLLADTFAEAATAPLGSDAEHEGSEKAIQLAVAVMDSLMRTYVDQAIAGRRMQSPTLPTFFACRVGSRPVADPEVPGFVAALNAAMVAFQWREIEPVHGRFQWDAYDRQIQWCRDQGLRIIGGPLLQLDRHQIPDGLYVWEGDFDQILANVQHYVRAVVERYRGKVHVWNCAARMNLECAVRLSEEERLRLVVGVIDEVQRLDARTPYIISFDQPWAEYLASADSDFSPLHFADSLVRAELGLAGIALEMNLGYWPHGTPLRDWFEISRQLDRWNFLGLPLLVIASSPSGISADEKSLVPASTSSCPGSTPSLESQQRMIDGLASLALAKSFVHGFIWNDLTDAGSHEFAHGGLFDAHGRPKPSLQRLATLRKQFLS